MNDQMKRSNLSLSYGIVNNSSSDGYGYERYAAQSPPKRHDNSINEVDEEFEGSHVMQMEKDTLKLRRDLQDAIASKKSAESRILAYV